MSPDSCLADLDDLALYTGHTVLFGLLAQEPGIRCCIEVIGVAQRVFLQETKLARSRGHQLRGIATEVFAEAKLLRF